MMTQQFDKFTASELYCPKCRVAQPVRERLLLVLPTGELYEFLCTECGSSLGKRTVTCAPVARAVPAPAPRALARQLPRQAHSRSRSR
jgi:hypothetical protein